MIETSKTVDSLNQIINGLSKLAQTVLEKVLEAGEQAAQSKVKGKLTDTLEKEIAKTTGTLKTTKYYARFVENGRPDIYAQKGKLLKFSINGRTIYAKHVKGVKARPFMKVAGQTMKSKIVSIFNDEWKKLLK